MAGSQTLLAEAWIETSLCEGGLAIYIIISNVYNLLTPSILFLGMYMLAYVSKDMYKKEHHPIVYISKRLD